MKFKYCLRHRFNSLTVTSDLISIFRFCCPLIKIGPTHPTFRADTTCDTISCVIWSSSNINFPVQLKMIEKNLHFVLIDWVWVVSWKILMLRFPQNPICHPEN
uniref:CSON010689 protein n=1 Tax=Culicoides sonorensis TaxID=179676 RepID=A0A336LLC5_CULSO